MIYKSLNEAEKLLIGASLTPVTLFGKAVKTLMTTVGTLTSNVGTLTSNVGTLTSNVNGIVQRIEVFSVTGTLGTGTITFDKTAGDLYDAISLGKSIKLTYATGESASTELINSITAAKNTSGATVTYAFRMSDHSGNNYSVSSLDSTASVVLTLEVVHP